MKGVLIRGSGHTDTKDVHTVGKKKATGGHSKKVDLCKPRREA